MVNILVNSERRRLKKKKEEEGQDISSDLKEFGEHMRKELSVWPETENDDCVISL